MTKPRPYGHYFILEKIAQGGMAEIFKGLTYDFSGLKKFIVIKRILPHIAVNQDFIRMLIDEAKIAVRLSHGNIAQTYDLGKVAEDYFIVMEYVEGRTISQIYKKAVALKENIPIPMVAYIVGEICQGLDYIHRRQDEFGKELGIVHCDISPQNVIVSPSGNVKIVDFGVAKAAFKLSEKERGVLKGKFAYMSPEQIDGIHVESNSDIFSTGVVLWEALTGRRLFKKKANPETIQAVQAMTMYPPSAYRNEIPSEMDEIVMKSLERNPKKRYQSAADMALDLTKFNLKHFPEFKSARISDFMNEIFQDEENTGDIYQERTQHEELTVLDKVVRDDSDEDSQTPVEETMIIDPQELDFHSIFEDIEMDEVSEVTRAIGLGEGDEEDSPGPGAPPELEDPTGDMPGKTVGSSPFGGGNRLPPSGKALARRRWIQGGLALIALLVFYGLFHLMFSNTPAKIVIEFEPRDARAYLNGKLLKGSSPIHLKDLKPREDYLVRLEREGYQTAEQKAYLFPAWTKTLQFELKKISSGLIEVTSKPEGAAIYLDGQATGKVTPAVFEAQRLRFPIVVGLSQGGPPTWKQDLPVAPPGNFKVHGDLTVPYGTLDIRSSPSGAWVTLGKKKLGKTPIYSAQVPAKQGLKLIIELGGYKTHQQKVFLKPGQKEEIYQALQKEASR